MVMALPTGDGSTPTRISTGQRMSISSCIWIPGTQCFSRNDGRSGPTEPNAMHTRPFVACGDQVADSGVVLRDVCQSWLPSVTCSATKLEGKVG